MRGGYLLSINFIRREGMSALGEVGQQLFGATEARSVHSGSGHSRMPIGRRRFGLANFSRALAGSEGASGSFEPGERTESRSEAPDCACPGRRWPLSGAGEGGFIRCCGLRRASPQLPSVPLPYTACQERTSCYRSCLSIAIATSIFRIFRRRSMTSLPALGQPILVASSRFQRA